MPVTQGERTHRTMPTKRRWAALGAAVVILTIGVAPYLSSAADHLDSPSVIADPRADIGDLYAWTLVATARDPPPPAPSRTCTTPRLRRPAHVHRRIRQNGAVDAAFHRSVGRCAIRERRVGHSRRAGNPAIDHAERSTMSTKQAGRRAALAVAVFGAGAAAGTVEASTQPDAQLRSTTSASTPAPCRARPRGATCSPTGGRKSRETKRPPPGGRFAFYSLSVRSPSPAGATGSTGGTVTCSGVTSPGMKVMSTSSPGSPSSFILRATRMVEPGSSWRPST